MYMSTQTHCSLKIQSINRGSAAASVKQIDLWAQITVSRNILLRVSLDAVMSSCKMEIIICTNTTAVHINGHQLWLIFIINVFFPFLLK